MDTSIDSTSSLTLKLQTPTTRIPLLTTQHSSTKPHTLIHSVPLTTPGSHTLRVLSTSTAGHHLRKFYKFDVLHPFSLNSTSKTLPDSTILTSLTVKSLLTEGEKITVLFDPSGGDNLTTEVDTFFLMPSCEKTIIGKCCAQNIVKFFWLEGGWRLFSTPPPSLSLAFPSGTT